ncbi:hypothetical protein BTHE_1974 [Bifidobacterium thermophilum]|nr:hypothetical protein BTHE_1974 [Bifidobacterium thermophilum]
MHRESVQRTVLTALHPASRSMPHGRRSLRSTPMISTTSRVPVMRNVSKSTRNVRKSRRCCLSTISIKARSPMTPSARDAVREIPRRQAGWKPMR